MRSFLLAIILLPVIFLTSCEEKKDDARMNNNYNVIFITPKKERMYLGTVRGISSCKYTASSYYAKRLWIGNGWDYVCCLRTKESQCAEEHKYEEEGQGK